MSVKAPDSWSNRLKSIAEGLSACIPEVGKVVKFLIGFFWPEEKESIWSMIEEHVEHLVERKILEYELQKRMLVLNGLRDSMRMYAQASNNEKASLLSAILVSYNNLYEELTGSKNAIHLIPVTISHGYLHLTMLRERYEHGQEMYKDAANKNQWKKELTEKVEDYKAFFLKIYPKWREWRSGEIRVTCYRSKGAMVLPPFFFYIAHGETKDDMTGETVRDDDSWNAIEKYFKPVQKRAKQRMFHEVDAKMMMEAYIRTFSLDTFLPDHYKDKPKAPPEVGEVSYGPYSIALKPGSHSKEDYANIYNAVQSDKCGVITKIYVWAWNSVDRIQFCYEGRGLGAKYGDSTNDDKPAIKNEIILDNKYVTGVRAGFSHGLLARIQFHFSDGMSSPCYGNKDGWGMALDQELRSDGDFRLVGVEAREGRGPSSTRGVAEIRLIFHHVSCMLRHRHPVINLELP